MGRYGKSALGFGRADAMGPRGVLANQGEFFVVFGRAGALVRRSAVGGGEAAGVEFLRLEESSDEGLRHGGVLNYGDAVEPTRLAAMAFLDVYPVDPLGYILGEREREIEREREREREKQRQQRERQQRETA